MKKYYNQLLQATVFPEQQHIFFYGGIFSQWAECTYQMKIGDDNVLLNCAEQAMMLYKAYVFNDLHAYDIIKSLDNPREQKFYGKQVKGYNEEKWNEVNVDFVSESNYQKFRQNVAWKELLLMTHPYTLVEASPYDPKWGIGYSENHPNLLTEMANWGKNLLGICIMNARDRLISNLKGGE